MKRDIKYLDDAGLAKQAKDLLAVRGFDPVLGARPLRRTVQREIEDTLAEKMLFGEVGPGQIVVVGVEGEGPTATFTFRVVKVPERVSICACTSRAWTTIR